MCQGGFEPHRVEKKIKRNCPEEEEFKEEFGMAGSDSWHDYIDISDLFNGEGLFERNSESEKVFHTIKQSQPTQQSEQHH